jgi:hypothetical protein
MKLKEIVTEGLKGNWNYGTVFHLNAPKLKALQKHATDAGDARVLDLIKQVQNDRYETSKKRAAELKRERAEDARQAKRRNDPTKLTKKEAEEVGRKIEEVNGAYFPDGDPIDHLGPWVKRRFGVEWGIGEILDQGAKTLGKYKDYYDYLSKMWDAYVEDGFFPDLKDRQNPWKS